jgi:hypothetical protein
MNNDESRTCKNARDFCLRSSSTRPGRAFMPMKRASCDGYASCLMLSHVVYSVDRIGTNLAVRFNLAYTTLRPQSLKGR